MRISSPIVRILKKIKTHDGVSAFEAVIKYLHDVEEMSVQEIAAILEVGGGTVYKIVKRRKVV